MKIRDVVKTIRRDGWFIVGTKGGHRQFKHPFKHGRVTVAGHPNDDLALGTLNSIWKQAQIKREKR
ncbi:type II toxin-antitoxin system HicA family toxin [bacterium]|nr:type II toxin-antitoxin system HicA family toxin [bacterium]